MPGKCSNALSCDILLYIRMVIVVHSMLVKLCILADHLLVKEQAMQLKRVTYVNDSATPALI